MSTELDVSTELEQYKWGFSKPENYVFKSRKGLSHEIVEEISQLKGEPQWMRDFRHKSLDIFLAKPMPTWGGDLSTIDFEDIYYYIKPTQEAGKTWDDLPKEIKDTFEQLGIPEAERKYLAGVGAQYECLSGDTRVYTARGLVPIREIQPGDTVFSFDEETNRIIPARVQATAEKGEREVFEVRVGTRRIKATANHPFLALTYQKAEDRQRGRYTREWEYLENLAVGDLVAVTKTLPETGVEYDLRQPEIEPNWRYNAVILPESTTDDLMWWFGLYIGDGFIHFTQGADKARVEFAIPASDAAVRDELVRVTKKLFGITPTVSDVYRVTVNSTIVARFVEVNGFTGKALEKRVPSWVFGLPAAQKLAFLGGYLDSDGYVRDAEKNHDVVLTSGNRELMKDMTELLSLCGLPTSEIHRFESKHPTEAGRMVVGYRIEVAGPFERIASRSPRRLERMSKRKYHHDYSSAHGTYFQRHTTEFHGYAKIEAITPAGTEMVYDIEVDGPHNFVAEGLVVHNSEVIYHKVREDLERQGVIFVDPTTALREHEELFRKYWATVIPPNDNKFAALNSAVWSGGSFIYIPKGVRVEIPLQAYFRINAKNMGQFERTLIIADEGSYVHYVEGCTAPTYTSDSLHSAVVEIFVHKDARVRYTTIQNWSKNVYNLVTKRAVAYEGATMEWVDGNLGSKLTMKYPAVWLMGQHARGEVLSVAFAGTGQHQDAGGKVVHVAPNTSSQIVSKSISKGKGRSSYRGLLKVNKGATGVKSNVRCDALLLDETSRTDTYPYIEIEEEDVEVGHEATVSKVGEEQLFYLMSRGLSESEAYSMIVSGFIEPIAKELPLEYAVELNRLIQLEMSGSVG
jgi:Fe-S cluster assembly protein SufB